MMLGRVMLREPRWPLRAASELGDECSGRCSTTGRGRMGRAAAGTRAVAGRGAVRSAALPGAAYGDARCGAALPGAAYGDAGVGCGDARYIAAMPGAVCGDSAGLGASMVAFCFRSRRPAACTLSSPREARSGVNGSRTRPKSREA